MIRIRLPLPANVKLVDPASCSVDNQPAPCESATKYRVSDASFADVWRAVPSVLGVVYSGADPDALAWPRGPNPRGGYLSDARAGTLAQQASGAFLDHAQVTTAPSANDLDDIAAYERRLVADPEPELDELKAKGKEIFERTCAQCHNGKGMSTPISEEGQELVHFMDLHVSCPRPVDATSPARWSFAECAPGRAKNEQTYEISFSDGFKQLRTTTDPGRALLSGFVHSAQVADDGTCVHPPCGAEFADDWQKFDITALHGISKTAPYFHDNSAATLEDVVIHYEEFFKRELAVLPPTDAPPFLSTDNVNRDRPNVPEERAALIAYLEVL